MLGFASVRGRGYGCTSKYTAERPSLANTPLFIYQMQNTVPVAWVLRVM